MHIKRHHHVRHHIHKHHKKYLFGGIGVFAIGKVLASLFLGIGIFEFSKNDISKADFESRSKNQVVVNTGVVLNFTGNITPGFLRSLNGTTTPIYSPNLIGDFHFDTPEQTTEEDLNPLADSIRDFAASANNNGWTYQYGTPTTPTAMTFNSTVELRGMGFPIEDYAYTNIGKGIAHPGNQNILRRWRNTTLGNKDVNVVSTLNDDENNCGNGINYNTYIAGSYIGTISLAAGSRDSNDYSHIPICTNCIGSTCNGTTLTGSTDTMGKVCRAENTYYCGHGCYNLYTITETPVSLIDTGFSNNFSDIKLERSGMIKNNDNLIFEINGSGNSQCDGTHVHLQVYELNQNNNNVSAPTWTGNGKRYGAIELYGSGGVGAGTGMNGSNNQITLSAWINTMDNVRRQGVITKWNAYGISVKSGTLWVEFSPYWIWSDTGIPINTGERTHVAATYDGSTIKAYKNGSGLRSKNINGTLASNQNAVFIGNDQVNERGFSGMIDEVRFYNIALNGNQINTLYTSNLKEKTPNNREFINSESGFKDGRYAYTGAYKTTEDNGRKLISYTYDTTTTETQCSCDTYMGMQCGTGDIVTNIGKCYDGLGGSNYYIREIGGITTGLLIIDYNPPKTGSISTLSANEGSPIHIVWNTAPIDIGIGIPALTGYSRDIDSDGKMDIDNTGNTIYIEAKKDLSGGSATVQISDFLATTLPGHTTTQTGITYQRNNVGAPTTTGIVGLTGNEGTILHIIWEGHDRNPNEGIGVDTSSTSTGFSWDIDADGIFDIQNTGADIYILPRKDVSSGNLIIKISDKLGYTSQTGAKYQRNNVGAPSGTLGGLTGNEGTPITITITANDNNPGAGIGVNPMGYNRDLDNDGNFEIQNTGPNLTIQAKKNVYSGIVNVQISDLLGQTKTISGTSYQWTNVGSPTTTSVSGLIEDEETDLDITWNFNDNNPGAGTGVDTSSGCTRTVDISGQSLTYENTGCTFHLPKQHEPVTGNISIKGIDRIGHESLLWTGIFGWINSGFQTKDLRGTGEIGTNIYFFASGYDLGGTTNTGYQRYSGYNCLQQNILSGQTKQKFIAIQESEFAGTGIFSYVMYDAQGLSGRCATATGIWKESTVISWNTEADLAGGSSAQIMGITGTISEQSTQGICRISADSGSTQYQAFSTGKGDDYCIVNTNNSGKIVLGRRNIQINKTILQLTGIGISSIFSNTTGGYLFSIRENNIANIQFILSGTIRNIYNTNLLGLYSFDKILLSNNQRDFSAIQYGKDWGYFRSPYNSRKYYSLSYNPTGKQRDIDPDYLQYDGMFIDKSQINPGVKYGDAVLAWKSPVNASIEIESSIEDENSFCGDKITYSVLHGTTKIFSGDYGTAHIETIVQKGDLLYFRIGSNDNEDNDCDNTRVNINIYQLPETNIGPNTQSTHGSHTGAIYASTGRFGGAYIYANSGDIVSVGSGLRNTTGDEISIATRVYREKEDPNQTIIQKRFSFGLVLYNNTIRVTNKTNIKRYNTNIGIETGTRTHIVFTYDKISGNISLYKNGEQKRQGDAQGAGQINPSNRPTTIGYSAENGQRKGMIDEVSIYNKALSADDIKILGTFNLSKLDKDHWIIGAKDTSFFQDGKFSRTGIVHTGNITNKLNITGNITIDFFAPIRSGVEGLTGIEGSSIIITGYRFDSGVGIATTGYNRDMNGDGDFNDSGVDILNTGNSITILPQKDVSSGNISIQAIDKIGHISNLRTGTYQRIGVGSPITTNINGLTGYENQELNITRTGYDTGGINTISGFNRDLNGDGDFNDNEDIKNTGNNIRIAAQDEPSSGKISIEISDIMGHTTLRTGVYERINQAPFVEPIIIINGAKVGNKITFTGSAVDTGSILGYQWYSSGSCNNIYSITGATGSTYTTSRDYSGIYHFAYRVTDNQGSGQCENNVVGERTDINIMTTLNTGMDLSGHQQGNISLAGTTIQGIIENGKQGVCSSIGNTVYYNAYTTGRGNDYCIIDTTSGNIVLGRYKINTLNPRFTITGQQDMSGNRMLSDTTTPLQISFLQNSIQGFSRTINSLPTSLYGSGILGMYTFDKILLADSQSDFSPIQNGNNRSYHRSPIGSTNNRFNLIYDEQDDQRIINNNYSQDYEGLFINKNSLKPGGNIYGDVILGWTPNNSTKAEIETTILPQVAGCGGDGITYTLYNGTTSIGTGGFGITKLETSITTGQTIYIRINQNQNNDCDVSNYRIKIYQLPETDIGIYNNHGINSGGVYTNTGKFNGAMIFNANNQSIILPANVINTGKMSINMRVYRESENQNQTLIQKQGSFGMILLNDTIHITNQTTDKRYNTNVQLETGVWNNLVWTYNGDTMRLYKNTKEVWSGKIKGYIPATTSQTSIGYSPQYGQRRGMIDELRIYNYAISPEDIQNLYFFALAQTQKSTRTITSSKKTNIDFAGSRTGVLQPQNIATTGSFIIDTQGPVISGTVLGSTGYEGEELFITGYRYDAGVGLATNALFTATIPANQEPGTGSITFTGIDTLGHVSTFTQNTQRINKAPFVKGNTFFGYQYAPLALSADAIDTGSTITYQRYNSDNCNDIYIISGATNSIYSPIKNTVETGVFAYQARDQQGLGNCATVTGVWRDIGIVTDPNTGINLQGATTYTFTGLTGTILFSGNLGTCTSDNLNSYYTGNTGSRGDDYCILRKSDGKDIVIGLLNMNVHTPLLTFSGTSSAQKLFTGRNNAITLSLQETYIANLGILRNKDLLGFYNFDRILLADNQRDFFPVQSGNNRSYLRGAKGGSYTYPLVYDTIGNQWIINSESGFQEMDDLFVDKYQLNPGVNYGDVIVQRKSPVSASIDIESSLTDANTTCGNGIEYSLLKNDQEIYSGNYGETTVKTTVISGDILSARINSKGNNDCDNSSLHLQIYQNPEADLSPYKNHGSLTGGVAYTIYGKVNGAFNFSDTGNVINLGTNLRAPKMTISTRVYKMSNDTNQTIIQKRGSYGIVISSGTIQVNNKTTSKRYDTATGLENNTRIHLAWTYDGTEMKLYKNGIEIWNTNFIGTIPNSIYPTNVGYSLQNGQRKGMIDEIRVYSGALNSGEIYTLYTTMYNRITKDRRNITHMLNNALTDGVYQFTRTGTNIYTQSATLSSIATIDHYGPIVTGISGLTGYEGNELMITGYRYDSGVGMMSGISIFTGLISALQEPGTGIITFTGIDIVGRKTVFSTGIQWINQAPTSLGNVLVGEMGTNITFIANGYDPGGTTNTGYQRYSGFDCTNILSGQTGNTLITGFNTTGTHIFSYYIRDAQGSGSNCSTMTGIRTGIKEFVDYTLLLTGNGNGSSTSGDRTNIYTYVGLTTGHQVTIQGTQGTCILTGTNKETVLYTPFATGRGNDSCQIQLDDGTDIIIGIQNINTEIINTRSNITPNTGILTIPYTSRTIRIQNRGGESVVLGWMDQMIPLSTDNLLARYNFDKVKIADLQNDYGKTQEEGQRTYNWNSNGNNNLLHYNPITTSWIIDEPLQDYENVYSTQTITNPGANKYGDIIYERTSSVTGNIEISTVLSDANTKCGNGIHYKAKINNTIIDESDYENSFMDTRLKELFITPGEKLSFSIGSKNDNTCDETERNIQIYLLPNNDLTFKGKIQGSGTYITQGKNGGAYSISNNGENINLGTGLSTRTGTFMFRIQGNSASTDQTLINKNGSYGLSIRNSYLSVSTNTNGLRTATTIPRDQLLNGNRNHLARTYNGSEMDIYLNGVLSRTGRVIGYFPTNTAPTLLGYSSENGQFLGNIDEIRIYNYALSGETIQQLYQTSFLQKDAYNREITSSQTGLHDGHYLWTGRIGNTITITGETIIDLIPPYITGAVGLTGNEGEDKIITLIGIDTGAGIDLSGFDRDFNNDGIFELTGKTISIIISGAQEPGIQNIRVRAKDLINRSTLLTGNIIRSNVPIQTIDLYQTGYENTIISFSASGYDPLGTTNTGYQRYLGTGCGSGNKILGANKKLFSTGRYEPVIETFSYTMRDAQGMTGTCSTATGTRENVAPTSSGTTIHNGGKTEISFTGIVSDVGGSTFNYQRYLGTGCTNRILGATGNTFTTGSEKAMIKSFSYRVRDAQGMTGFDTIETGNTCSNVTGYRDAINPIANDFILLPNPLTNKTATGNRRTLSLARDSEFNLVITGTLFSSGSKGICKLSGDIISYLPNQGQTGDDLCILKLTDNNSGTTYTNINIYGIETKSPITYITNTTGYWRTINGTGIAFSFLYTDDSSGQTYYRIINGDTSCGTGIYTQYTSGTVTITGRTTGIQNTRTVCYFSKDIHNNTENYKKQLYTIDKTILNAYGSITPYTNNGQLTLLITSNKFCTGTITGILASGIPLIINTGSNTITIQSTQSQGNYQAQLHLETNDSLDGVVNQILSYMIDTTVPNNATLSEKVETTTQYTTKRSAATDNSNAIQGYNYQVINENGIILKAGFTESTNISINKSDVSSSKTITIRVQSKDQAGNIGSRTTLTSFTIPQTTQTETLDREPAAFSFEKQTNAQRNMDYTSEKITIIGLSSGATTPISLSTGKLYINGTETSLPAQGKNGDKVNIELTASKYYNETTEATLTIGTTSATYIIQTEKKASTSSSSSSSSSNSFRDKLKELLTNWQSTTSTGDTHNSAGTTTNTKVDSSTIDTQRISAPYKAPNGKIYKLFKTKEGKYSSYDFMFMKYFTTLTELKKYIDKNNPKK